MIINGKERDFAYTVEAADEIGKLCKNCPFEIINDCHF